MKSAPRSPIWMLRLTLCALFSLSVLIFASCKKAEEIKAETVSVESLSTDPAPELAPPKVSGGSLNKFFPKDEGDWDVVFTQEKEGFSQAKLQKDGAELATLSVSDFAGNTKGLAKFENTGMTLGGHPAIPQGKNGTLVLAGRFQVSVRSKDAAFTVDDRDSWIQKFDLAGLAAMAK